jgi:hypothetical protein
MTLRSQPQSGIQTLWVTAAMLSALAKHVIVEGGTVTAEQLADWTAHDLTHEQRVHASSKLCALGYFRHKPRIVDGLRVDTYTLTAEGDAAVRAAAEGLQRKSGPKGSRKQNPVKPEALTTRLWGLVRARRIVDSDAAARTLCTAGDEEFERVRATVRKTLRRWELAGALQAGTRRVATEGQGKTSNGSKRYVLVHDTGPTPPTWRPVLRAAKQAAKQTAGGPAE